MSSEPTGEKTGTWALVLTRPEIGLAIDGVALLIKSQEPNPARPLLRKLQDAYAASSAAATPESNR